MKPPSIANVLTRPLRRRWVTRAALGALALPLALGLAACSSLTARAPEKPPIVMVHGNGDSAALWQTTMWRFESNGWPRERLHAIELPFPLARDDDTRAQPGRTSTAEHMAFLKSEVETVLRRTGAAQVVLMGNSRGGNAIRNYVQNGGGDKTVSHAILGGTPNHGVWAVPLAGLSDHSEFAGHGAFLRGLNAPKNAAGDEVTGPVRWLTVRSADNDKFAQPDGLWIGKRGTATGVTAAGPELKGARNVVIPRIDHRETSYSQPAFEAALAFITGQTTPAAAIAPEGPRVRLAGRVTGMGLDTQNASSGNFQNNLPLAGARVEIYAINSDSGERTGAALSATTVGADGRYGPVEVPSGSALEFVVSAPGYATSHIYRSGFPRSSSIVNLRLERIAPADRDAQAMVQFVRPRGYFDPPRDRMSLDGKAPPGVPPGAGVASSKLKLTSAAPRAITAEFNGERLVGRVWPLAEQRVTVLELTY